MPIYKVNGEIYDIPANKQEAFEKKYPDASVSYISGNDAYDIPIGKRESFLTKFPDAQLETNYQSSEVPIFNDAPNSQLNAYKQPESEEETIRGFGAAAKQSAKSLGAGVRNAWGEFTNMFTGSSRDDVKALSEFDRMIAEGKDVAEETENTWSGIGGDLRTAALEILPNFLVKGWKERVHDKAEEQKILRNIHDALKETNGDVDKARSLLVERAKDMSYGDTQMAMAAETMSGMKPTEGFGAWLGENAVQMIPSASALIVGAVTKSPTAARIIGQLGMGGMTAATAGQSMYEARQSGANDYETRKVGIVDGMIEYLTEKIPFDRYTKRLTGKVRKETAEALSDALSSPNSPAKEEMQNVLTKANEVLGGKLFSKKSATDYLLDMAAEGASEFSAEALQTITSIIYEEPENYPTITEVLSNGWQGFLAGAFMGAVLGGSSAALANHQHKERRRQQGFVKIALVDNGENGQDVGEVVAYDPEADRFTITDGNNSYEVEREAIKQTFDYTVGEFESGIYRQLEDDAIASGNVSNGQVVASADRLGNARQKLEDAMSQAGYTDEQKNTVFADLDKGDVPDFHPQAKALWNAADSYTDALNRDREIQSAREARADNERKSVLDAMQQQMGGEFWQKGSTTMQENGMEIVGPGMVEVGTMQNGKQVYILSTPNDNGEVPAVTEDGKKMFIRHTDLQEGTQLMPLQEFLDAKVSEQRQQAEQLRMAQEAAPQLDAIRQKYQMGVQVNLGTEESPTLGQVIGIKPENDGVIIQTESGIAPCTFEQLADMEGTPIRVMTDAQQAAAEAAEIQAAEAARMTELAQTPEQISEAEKETDNAAQMENVATETPLPTNPDGSVNEDALFRESPERWAVWNDEQSQDGGVSSAQYIETKLAKAQARLAELQNMYSVEDSLNKKRTIQAEIVKQQGVVDELAGVMQKYAPAETVQSTPVVAQQERTTESVLASLNDGTLTEEEIRENIDANLAEAQKSYDKYAKKAPKMGTDKDAYLAEKQKYEQGLPALQQEIDFWNGVKQAYEGAMQQESLPTEESMRPELTEEDMNPYTPQELAARELGLKEGGIKLLWDSVRAHTGFGNGERQKFFGIFRSKEKGGMTIEAAGDRLMEIDREYDLGLLDQSDLMAGVNAILDVLGDTQTIGDLRNYIANNREAQVAKEAAAAYSAMNAEFKATHGMTMEESTHADHVAMLELMQGKALSEAEQYEINVKFAEEENQYGTNEYQSEAGEVSRGESGENQSDVARGVDSSYRQGDSILQETQSDNTGGETISVGQTTEDISEGNEQDGNTSVHAGEQTSEVSRIFAPSAEVIAKIVAERREAVHERINTWINKLGIKINIIDSYRDVENEDARINISKGNKTFGWFEQSTGEIFIYVPDFLSYDTEVANEEIDRTILHEGVAHKGLRDMLGEEKFGELCDRVWNEIMTEKQRDEFINYPGVNGNTRAAADEFIASVSENVKQDTVWDKIANFFKDILNSIGIDIKVKDNDLKGLLKQSYRRYRKGEAKINPNDNMQSEGNVRFRTASGNLVGLHNISEDKLRKVIRMGGSANPSTAVIDITRQSFSSYGDISFVMPSSLVDAGTGRNAGTFTADAWTPTYPVVSKRFSDDKLQRAYWRDVSAIPEEMSHEVRMAFDSWLDDRNASGLAYMFLHERGEAPEMVRVEAKFPQEIKDKLSAIIGENRSGLYELSEEEKQAVLDLYIQENFEGNREEFDKSIAEHIQRIEDRLSTGKVPSFVEKRITMDLQWMKEHGYNYDNLSSFVNKIVSDIRHAGEVNDAATTNRSLDYIKDNGLEQEFDKWKESLNDRYGIKEYLFDGYTPSGNQRWLPNTIENASRLMNKQGLAGATGMAVSFSRFVATLAPKKKTLSDIRASKDRLVEDERLVDDFREKWSEVFFDLGIKCQPGAKGYEDYGLARLTEAAQKKNPGAYLKKEYGVELSQEDLQKLAEMVKVIKTEFPARYFETKFQRPVYLNEFAAAVMPTTTSEDIKQAVSEAGLPIYEYDSSVEGSRKEATLKATEGEGIRFRTARTEEEFNATQQEAVREKGIIVSGLWEVSVNVVDVPKHDFTGTGKTALRKAEDWALQNIAKEHIYHEGLDDEFRYLIDKDAIAKFLSQSSTKASDNLGVHLAALKMLPQIIDNSIDVEIHPDYRKVDGVRSAENGVKDEKLLVHRMYGAIGIDGKVYRTKTTIHEFRDKTNEAYDYKITEIELVISGPASGNALKSPISVPAAKVLKGVEKSYDKGVKVLDVDYFRAIEAGYVETAQRMVNEAARLAGYDSNSDYQGSLAFNGAAPSGYAYYDTKEERVEAWESEEYEDDQTLGDYKDAGIDIGNLGWSLTSPVAQRMGNKYTRESIKNLADAVNSDSRKIKVYRAVDADIKEDSVRNGDWVTPSRAYAEYHIGLQDWKEGRIIEQEVDIDDIWWDGNDINEWGYNDGKGYAYKNTPNNRKLLAPVTYDDNGNVIPLSERFNEEKDDIRFRTRRSDESPAEFLKEAVAEFENKYNVAAPASIIKVPTRREFAKALDLELADIDEQFHNSLLEAWKNAFGMYLPLYDEDNNITHNIVIFAKDTHRASYISDASLFHENIHGFVKDNPELLELGRWLYETDVQDRNILTIRPLADTYPEHKRHEEMLTHYVSMMMAVGGSQRALDTLPEEYKPLLNYIYERFGYNPETEDGERIRRYDSESREISGRTWTNGQGVTVTKGEREGDGNGNFFRTIGSPTEDVVKEGLHLKGEGFTNLAADIFKGLPEEIRREVIENASRDNYDLKKATLQMSASLAEKAELTDEEIELAKLIAQKLEDAVLASGVEMTRPFTTNEALWMLYQSTNPTSEYDIIGNARKAVVASNLGFSKSQQEEQEKDADNIRFRSARGAAANSAAAMYNNEQRSAWGMLRETYQDMYRSVKNLIEAIEQTTGKVAQSWENILTSLNALSSKNLADKKKYLRDFLTPMWDAAIKIRDNYHKSIEEIERYLMIKHGLERNRVLAARDARNFYREQADQEIAAIKADKSLSKAEQKTRIQRVEDTYNNHVSDIEAGIDAKFQEFRSKDYGGLTALFSDFADYGTRDDYESEELYQEAALAARTPKYATLAETELAAQKEVKAFEKEVDKALIDNLWNKINAATKETLRHQYANNMLTKEQYERVRDMFEFYVPLRGFVDTTAEDTYSYYVSGQQSKFANPLQGAKGRKTQAETPLGWIGSMAESAIQMDNKNTAKLALYYFAVNRPDNDILKITPTWYEWTGEVDADGKKIFEPVYPTFNGPQSGSAMQAQMDAFESMMEQQAQAGNAYKGKQRIDLKEAVIRAPKSTPEHVVTVKVAGEDYSIIINANPRAAQAINGMLNIDKGENPLYRAARAILRFQASIKTSLAPLFWITNFMRDMSFAFINTNIRHDAGYTREFAKNYVRAFKAFSFVHKYKKAALGGTQIERYYTEFAENGGITGYTSLTNNTEYDQMMKAYANNARAGKFIKGIKSAFEVYQNVGESFEQISRFAAYITARESGKDISESIYEAKEVTINFNRKGSGKAITWDESGKMRRKNGKPLTDAERIFFVTLGGLSPIARSLFMFFNAGMQGVRMIAKLAHDYPGKSAAWAGIVFTMGLINAMMHAMMEDDDEYLDMPDYVRRSNVLIGRNGYYFKWSLPHEVRPFYAMADIFVQHAMGRKPNENIAAELAETFGEWLPINPFKDGLKSITPDILRPFVEISTNEDFTGSPIYRENRWMTEEEQNNMPAYEKAFDSTSKVLVDVSEMLNDVSGGDYADAGFININPAVVEHLAHEYGGGPLRLAEQFFKTIGVMTGDQEFSIRNTPFLSTFMVAADDRYRNAHTNELFKYYKGIAEDTERRGREYKSEKDKERFDHLRTSEDFMIYQIYRKYEKMDKFYNEELKRAKNDSERKEIMSLQDAHRKRMIEEISKL